MSDWECDQGPLHQPWYRVGSVKFVTILFRPFPSLPTQSCGRDQLGPGCPRAPRCPRVPHSGRSGGREGKTSCPPSAKAQRGQVEHPPAPAATRCPPGAARGCGSASTGRQLDPGPARSPLPNLICLEQGEGIPAFLPPRAPTRPLPGPLTAVGRCPLARSAGVGAGALLSHQLLPPRTAPEAL